MEECSAKCLAGTRSTPRVLTAGWAHKPGYRIGGIVQIRAVRLNESALEAAPGQGSWRNQLNEKPASGAERDVVNFQHNVQPALMQKCSCPGKAGVSSWGGDTETNYR